MVEYRLAIEMNRCLQCAHVPECMTKGKTTLIQEDQSKWWAPNNYRSITCLLRIWKILTASIKIYFSLISRRLFLEELKGCRKGSRSIDQLMLSKNKTRRKQSSYDYKKAYMNPQSWIINSHKMYKISDEFINFIEKTTKKDPEIRNNSRGTSLAEAKIKEVFF